MSDPQFDIERATNGLVLALYLAAAVFLAVMLYFVLRDVAERQQAAEESASSVHRTTPPTYEPQRTGAMHDMSAAPLSRLLDA